MYKLTICDDYYSDALNTELCRFVSSNTADLIQMQLDFIEDTDYNLEYIFPSAYVTSHRREECFTILRTIRDRLKSNVMYQEFTPLQQYVLYNVIESWIQYYQDTPEMAYQIQYKLSDYLKKLIQEETEEPDYIIECVLDIQEYSGLFFEDTDFDEESMRGFVEAAINNSEIFLKEMSYEDLDQYIEVMPADVAEDYKKFRDKQLLEKQNDTKLKEMKRTFDEDEHMITKKDSKKVFVVYGRKEPVRNEVELFLRQIGLEPIILCNQPDGGLTIIEKIEENTNVDFAVVLYTDCDRGKLEMDKELKPRARQNVVFEHGYLIARLTRKNVVALVEEGVELPSDISGMITISLAEQNWKQRVMRELKNCDMDFDWSKA